MGPSKRTSSLALVGVGVIVVIGVLGYLLAAPIFSEDGYPRAALTSNDVEIIKKVHVANIQLMLDSITEDDLIEFVDYLDAAGYWFVDQDKLNEKLTTTNDWHTYLCYVDEKYPELLEDVQHMFFCDGSLSYPENIYPKSSLTSDEINKLNKAVSDGFEDFLRSLPDDEAERSFFEYARSGPDGVDFRDSVTLPVTPTQWHRYYCYLIAEYPEVVPGADKLSCDGYLLNRPSNMLTIEEVREVYLTVADRVGQFPDADRLAFNDYIYSGPPLWDLESEVPESYYGTICHVHAGYPEVMDGFQEYVDRIDCGGRS